jgi:hypothetical protein
LVEQLVAVCAEQKQVHTAQDERHTGLCYAPAFMSCFPGQGKASFFGNHTDYGKTVLVE